MSPPSLVYELLGSGCYLDLAEVRLVEKECPLHVLDVRTRLDVPEPIPNLVLGRGPRRPRSPAVVPNRLALERDLTGTGRARRDRIRTTVVHGGHQADCPVLLLEIQHVPDTGVDVLDRVLPLVLLQSVLLLDRRRQLHHALTVLVRRDVVEVVDGLSQRIPAGLLHDEGLDQRRMDAVGQPRARDDRVQEHHPLRRLHGRQYVWCRHVRERTVQS